jgi:hypothetical protein
MDGSTSSTLPQKCAPEEFAVALDAEARRWHEISQNDPGVRPMRLAGSVIRHLGKECQRQARRVEVALVLAAQIQRQARTAAGQSAAELAAQAAKIAQLQADLVQERAINAALRAVAARPDQAIVKVEAQVQQSDTRTRHTRDAKGDLLESLTEVIRSEPPAAQPPERRAGFF